MKHLRLFIVFFMMCAGSAQAATLYVNGSTGNDANTYAQVAAETHKWATVGRAAWGSADRDNPVTAQAAAGADTVIVEAGIYDATGDGGAKHFPYYNPVNNGSAGNYITFQADGVVELRSSNVNGRALIGSYQKDYIVWDGFVLDENYIIVHSDSGPVVIWDCSYVTVKNLHITGLDQSWGDNHNGVRIELSDHATVQNCYMTGFSEDHGSGVTTYTSTDVLLEHNEVTNSQQGLFVKGANDGPFIIRYNYIHDSVVKGIRLGGLRAGGAKVYQNVLHDVDVAIHIEDFAADGPQNAQIVNNTLVSTTGNTDGRGSIWMMDHYGGVDTVEIKNNIITDSGASGIHLSNNDIVATLDSDYNLIYNNSVDFRDATSNLTLAQWQSAHSQDVNSTDGTDPLFTNSVAHDYTLESGSPCREGNAAEGVDVLDLDGDSSTVDPITIGAYITGDEIIGINGNGDDETPPATSGWDPAKSETGVGIDEDIVVHVTDGGDGVDGTTIEMIVESVTYCCSDGSCGNKTLGRTGTTADYTITHSHGDYGYLQEINVSIDADDLATVPNSMTTDTYSFTTESEPVAVSPSSSGASGGGSWN